MSTLDRKKIEKENRREFILKTAENIMSVHGVHGLNMDLVATETQLAKGTIYLYFKSKEEILSILTIKSRDMLFKAFEIAEKKHDNALDKLKAIIKANYFFYKENPLYYDLVSLYEGNNKLTETNEMYSFSENITGLVSGIILKAQAEGTLNRNIHPMHFTMSMWGMTVGILQLIKVRGNLMKEKMGVDEHDLLNTFLEVFENGVKK
jgi:TetR/AcrR family transcriptional regulator